MRIFSFCFLLFVLTFKNSYSQDCLLKVKNEFYCGSVPIQEFETSFNSNYLLANNKLNYFVYDLVASKFVSKGVCTGSASISPLGDKVASINYALVKVVDLKGKTLFELKDIEQVPTSVKFSFNGKFIVVGYQGGTVGFYSADNGSLLEKFTAGTFPIVSMQLSFNNKFLALGNYNGEFMLFELPSKNLLLTEKIFIEDLKEIQLNANAQRFAFKDEFNNVKYYVLNGTNLSPSLLNNKHNKINAVSFLGTNMVLLNTENGIKAYNYKDEEIKCGVNTNHNLSGGFVSAANAKTVIALNDRNNFVELDTKGLNPVPSEEYRNEFSKHLDFKECLVNNTQSDFYIVPEEKNNSLTIRLNQYSPGIANISLNIFTNDTCVKIPNIIKLTEQQLKSGEVVIPFKLKANSLREVSVIKIVSTGENNKTISDTCVIRLSGKSLTSPVELKKFESTPIDEIKTNAPFNLTLYLQSNENVSDVKIKVIKPANVNVFNESELVIYNPVPNQLNAIKIGLLYTKDFKGNRIPLKIEITDKEHLTPSVNPIIIDLPETKASSSDTVNNADNSETIYRGGTDPLKGVNVNKSSKTISTGKYYALLIGIDNYKGNWNKLKNAVNDAKAIEKTLHEKYRFDNFKTLYNESASRDAIIKELEWLIANTKENDNVFIYYSGHGEFKKELNKGFWVPVNATDMSTSNLISNSDIQTYIGGIKAKHTLLISDACFSGDIFRGNTINAAFENSEKYYKEVYEKPSRQALTSGGIEPVMDGGKDGHSIFAYYLLQTLNSNSSQFFDASQLYSKIKIPVVNNSDQTPNLNTIKNTGDQGGQFLFIKK